MTLQSHSKEAEVSGDVDAAKVAAMQAAELGNAVMIYSNSSGFLLFIPVFMYICSCLLKSLIGLSLYVEDIVSIENAFTKVYSYLLLFKSWLKLFSLDESSEQKPCWNGLPDHRSKEEVIVGKEEKHGYRRGIVMTLGYVNLYIAT